jgi:radical SAM superfamily enzyme YgiQ (UPF0313 family)
MPNSLLVYPKFPPSYWGAQYALEFIGKKSSMPPLGLLTVAGMFPANYQLKVVDMNVDPLKDEHLEWADMVFTSTMIVQKDSLREVVERARRAQVPVVAGGPHPTTFYDEMEGVDHFVLDEVENTFGEFLRDFENGRAQKIYRSPAKPSIKDAPPPRYDLIDIHAYGSMALQFSRGCPFDCEFCDITKLFGRVPRTKSAKQILAEFDVLYNLGWRGAMFLVDDNFIGNKRDAMQVLPEITKWQKARNYPFSLYTEASVNLSGLDDLLDAMVDAGFTMAFLGIETPNREALLKTKKAQNTHRHDDNFLLNAVRKIQEKGLQVTAGFILGLDSDGEEAFDAQIEFIQQAGIPTAMVGLLSALKGTDLYKRLQNEGRLLEESSGNNVSVSLNFRTEMDREVLIQGYKRVLSTLYDPGLKNYFDRCLTMLRRVNSRYRGPSRISKAEWMALAKSLKRQLLSRQGPAYLKFLATVLKEKPRVFAEAVRLAIMGYHFEKTTSQQIAVDEFKRYLEAEFDLFKQAVSRIATSEMQRIAEIQNSVRALLYRVHLKYDQIHEDFRYCLADALDSFKRSVESQIEEISAGSRLKLPTTD